MPLILAGLLAVTILVHMARPRDRFTISAYSFFEDRSSTRSSRWKPTIPLNSPALYLRLLAMCVVALAIWLQYAETLAASTSQVSLWIIVDTSASMSTIQGDTDRLTLARAEAIEAVNQVSAISNAKGSPCYRVSGFDQELLPYDPSVLQSSAAVERALAALMNRPLGTDLTMVTRSVNRAADPDSFTDCAPTHIVVITDQSPPIKLGTSTSPLVVWRNIASPVPNTGFVGISAERDPISGAVRAVDFQVQTFGPRSDAQIVITEPGGKQLGVEPLRWVGDSATYRLLPEAEGLFRAELLPLDAYAFDNVVGVEVPATEPIRVQCLLVDCTYLRQLGWADDNNGNHILTVSPIGTPIGVGPMLFVGPGYSTTSEPNIITYLREGHPLLADLNLDVLEQLYVPGSDLPDDAQPALSGMNGTWIAWRDSPLTAWIPGLPLLPIDEAATNATQTVFFTAVRWLLREKPLPVLYELTSPAAPEPLGNRNVLQSDEGDTFHEPNSQGTWSDLNTAPPSSSRQPIWPALIVLAILLIGVERVLAAAGQEKWR